MISNVLCLTGVMSALVNFWEMSTELYPCIDTYIHIYERLIKCMHIDITENVFGETRHLLMTDKRNYSTTLHINI